MDSKEVAAEGKRVIDEIRDVLMREWDPIGVKDEPLAWDEYDAYIGRTYRLLVDGSSDQVIADYLADVEQDRMGLGPSKPESLARVVQALRKLSLGQ